MSCSLELNFPYSVSSNELLLNRPLSNPVVKSLTDLLYDAFYASSRNLSLTPKPHVFRNSLQLAKSLFMGGIKPQFDKNDQYFDYYNKTPNHDLYFNNGELQYYNEAVLNGEIRLANDYINEVKDKAIILINNERELLAIPYYMRFSPYYAEKVREKLKRAYKAMGSYNKFIFITLTLNASNYKTQNEAKKSFNKAFNSLLTRIRRQYPNSSYIRTFEWQKNGLGIHAHILIAGVSFINKDWIKTTWDKINPSGWAIDLKGVRYFDNVGRAVNYIGKYITKQLRTDKDIALSPTLIINWASMTRAFSISRFSYDKTNSNQNPLSLAIKSSKGWVYLGSLPLNMLSSQLWTIIKPPDSNYWAILTNLGVAS